MIMSTIDKIAEMKNVMLNLLNLNNKKTYLIKAPTFSQNLPIGESVGMWNSCFCTVWVTHWNCIVMFSQESLYNKLCRIRSEWKQINIMILLVIITMHPKELPAYNIQCAGAPSSFTWGLTEATWDYSDNLKKKRKQQIRNFCNWDTHL